ncbi:MAG TPA: hypothetical protein PLM53_18635 [Spirochaetota bacterium]|nr:hypothetical protein [Spirochaetota bacterium]HQF10239.1 hypothetical protein [Spirochaetota bacterium]HQH99117.1 hypothetical protein [Spirochaetota bacterium]HQJ72772.1 hypothetical protein [Spirochaetota bacterium]
MKKILFIIMLLGTTGLFITCESDNLVFNTKDEPLLLLGVKPNAPAVTPPPAAIYIYSAGQQPNGNLGGRAGADALCTAANPTAGTTVHAFLSVDSSDLIIDLVPPAYRTGISVVDGGGANIISTDWASIWDGSIDMTLSAASVLGGGLEWWNGSNADGTLNSNNCSGWTSGSSMTIGQMGNSNFTNSSWITWGSLICSSGSNYLLCVAY